MEADRWTGDRRRGRMAWRWSAALLITLPMLLATPAGDLGAVAPTSIDIKDSRYLPPILTVPVGTTVRWTNHDEETHTVTSSAGRFGSLGLDLDETYTYTFTTPGTYPYTCDLHPFMGGTIVVQ